MEMKNLEDWYVHLLEDALDAEKQITKALPKMAEAAQSAPLRKAFEQHLNVTNTHIERLEQIFKDMGKTPEAITCKGMEGLVKEGDELIKKKSDFDPDVLDAALIAAAQKVEHYEIAGYGTAAAYAELLGQKDAAKVLHKIAAEEGSADQKLTTLAETRINKEAERQQAAKAKTNGRKKASEKKSGGMKSRAGSKSRSSTKSKSKAGAKVGARS
jgi:ferritin-like metal-binding protein YciE